MAEYLPRRFAARLIFCLYSPRFQRIITIHRRRGEYYTLNVWSRGKQLVLFSRESRCFPRRSRWKHQDSRKTKLTSFPAFPEGPYIKCFVIYLDFPLSNHIAKTNKQSAVRATTAQLYPGRDTFEFDQGHVTKNQLSQSSFCRKSSYITVLVETLFSATGYQSILLCINFKLGYC